VIVDLIDAENWSSMSADVKGDAYEGLLEKNAHLFHDLGSGLEAGRFGFLDPFGLHGFQFGCYKDVVMGQDKENMERVRGKSLAGNPINVIKSCSGSSGSCTQP
jgi:hypothetical protein